MPGKTQNEGKEEKKHLRTYFSWSFELQALLSVGVASTSSTLPGFDHFLVNEVMIQKSNSFTTELLHFLTTSSEKSLSFSSPLEDYCTSNEITMWTTKYVRAIIFGWTKFYVSKHL